MMEETRRSARATKGQNFKVETHDQNLEPKKKVKRNKKASEVVQEKPAEIIRCVCGAVETGDDDKDPWIACDGCDAWQHNICMGISAYGEDVPDQYYCERCHPQDHKELLSSIESNKKLWEERRRIYEREQAEALIEENSTKRRGKKKVKKTTDLPDILTTPKELPTIALASEKKSAQKNSGIKRKNKDISQDNEIPKDTEPKVRKLSAAQTPRQESPQLVLSMKTLDIDSTRHGAAKMLLKSLLHSIPQVIKSGAYTLGPTDTIELKAEHLAVTVENAVHDTHPDKAAYAKQSRAIASNMKHNLELSEGLLARTLSPQVLATMCSDDMASKKLKKEKEEMKARADKQSIMVTDDGPRVRRTHKGEELVEGDSFAVPNDNTVSSSRRRSTLDPNSDIGTRSRETSSSDHLESSAQINEISPRDDAKIAKAPGQVTAVQPLISPSAGKKSDQHGFDINKVFNSVQSPKLPQHRRKSVNNAPPINGPGEDPEIDQLLQDDSIESPPYSPAEPDSDPTIIWRGTVTMDSVAEFPAFAKHMGGVDITKSMATIQWSDVLARDLKIAGRIDHEKANEYLCSLRYSPPTDLVVVNVSPTGETYSEAFNELYDYFQSRNRYGVLTNKGIGNIRDTYLVPVPPSPVALPDFIINLEGHRVPEHRSEPLIIIALVIRNDWQPASEHHLSSRGLNGSIDGGVEKKSPTQSHSRTLSISGGAGPQMSPIGPPASFHSPVKTNFRPDEIQREIDQRKGEEAAKRILGDHIKSPTVAFLMPQAYQMREVEWNVISDILREDERARDDLQHLSVVLEQRMTGRS
ncbi:Transcription factor bye1 [Golovinomyces cichoracearum]|uniref:Transcription factor BYE1 n=1 Tax=Golovinomyces cichoracearum TaxID=62708 RepID=A0A420IRD7_9PEZI|nr:Transcription factor bye1 [Golovinomyces cichoracearum]